MNFYRISYHSICLILLFAALPLKAQFNPVLTMTLHHKEPGQERSNISSDTLGGRLAATYSPDGKLIATASAYGETVRAHDPMTGQVVWEFQILTEGLRSLSSTLPFMSMWIPW